MYPMLPTLTSCLSSEYRLVVRLVVSVAASASRTSSEASASTAAAVVTVVIISIAFVRGVPSRTRTGPCVQIVVIIHFRGILIPASIGRRSSEHVMRENRTETSGDAKGCTKKRARWPAVRFPPAFPYIAGMLLLSLLLLFLPSLSPPLLSLLLLPKFDW